MPDLATTLLAFVGLAVLYALAMALMKFASLIKQRPWIALTLIGVLSAALLASSSRPHTRADDASFEQTSGKVGRSLAAADHHDL